MSIDACSCSIENTAVSGWIPDTAVLGLEGLDEHETCGGVAGIDECFDAIQQLLVRDVRLLLDGEDLQDLLTNGTEVLRVEPTDTDSVVLEVDRNHDE